MGEGAGGGGTVSAGEKERCLAQGETSKMVRGQKFRCVESVLMTAYNESWGNRRVRA